MVSSLFVPLDGSPAAELPLPLAAAVARNAHASLELVSVHRPYVFDNPHAQNAWMTKVDPEREAEVIRSEEAYLAEAAGKAAADAGISPKTMVLTGSSVDAFAVASTLLETAKAHHSDLIVMTTRARGLVTRVGLGSVADELVRGSHVPLLLVPPTEEAVEGEATSELTHILVTLDGSDLSEQILAPAVELAALMGARCTLLRVIGAKEGVDVKVDAEQYLERQAASARERGVAVDTRVVQASRVSDAIVEAAETVGADVIALATHGYGGFKRLMFGSVADKLIQHARLPILVRCPTCAT